MKFKRIILPAIIAIILLVVGVYFGIIERQSEAGIFKGADGEIAQMSGLVVDTSKVNSEKVFTVNEPDTGQEFTILVNDSTKVRILNNKDRFVVSDFSQVKQGDGAVIVFAQGGLDVPAESVGILPGSISLSEEDK